MLYFDLLTDDIIIKILEINTYYIEKRIIFNIFDIK